MAEETWHTARLIPTSGINGAEEQERRATSALLAVMSAVKEFGRAIVKPLGAPAGPVETFIEVPFTHDGARVFPDGLVRVKRGQRTWTALVEVKTGKSTLDATQLDAYLDVARAHEFDALITISNEISSAPGVHPTAVDKRKLKRVALRHLSWTQVLSEAHLQKEHRGVADPDQAWILGELIRYLEHDRSGAMKFEDMGPSWVGVRDAIKSGTLRAADPGAQDVAARWDQLLQYLSLQLGRKLGIEVRPVVTRREQDDPAVRLGAVVAALVEQGALVGAIRVPNAVGPIELRADVRAGLLSCSVDVDAPRTGRPVTGVTWMLRQLKAAADDVRVDAFARHTRGSSTSALLSDLRGDPKLLVADPKKELKTFRVARTVPAGLKRGAGRGTFVTAVLEVVDDFYKTTVQGIKPWSEPPPRLRKEDLDEEREAGVPVALRSTALSSQDGSEHAEPGGPEPAEPAAGQ